MFKYNIDYKRRDALIFGDICQPEEKWVGGIKQFSISPSVLKQLIEERFIDPEDSQNDSPTAREFSEFFDNASDPDEWRAHGYAVSHDREDYRISIEGCVAEWWLREADSHQADMIAFANLFRLADEFELTTTKAYCWYD